MHEEELRMPFWSHLEELRKRLVRSVIAIAVGFSACFNFSEQILNLLEDRVLPALSFCTTLERVGRDGVPAEDAYLLRVMRQTAGARFCPLSSAMLVSSASNAASSTSSDSCFPIASSSR